MKRMWLAAVLALLAAAPAVAQQPELPPGVLTLEDAIRIAREHSPEFRRTANDLEVASSAIRSAWGAFLPNLSTSLSFGGNRRSSLSGEDAFGEPIERPERRVFRSSSASQSLSTGMTLFDGGATLRNLQAERVSYAGTEAAIAVARVALDARVARAFYDAVSRTSSIALEEQLLASARERLDNTEQLMRLAAANRADMLGAREDVLTYEQNVATARGEADKARIALATTLGVDPTSSITLDTMLPPIFDPATLDTEALVTRALETSPTVQQSEAALRVAAYRRSAAGASRWPTISASAGYSRSMGVTGGFGAFGNLNPSQNSGLSFGISASLPVFTRFQTSATVAAAAAAQEDAGHDLRAVRLQTESDVRAAVIDLVNAYNSLQRAEERVALSRERLELQLEQYRLGGGSFTELQNVIDRTAQAERQALDASFTFISMRVTLEEILGSRLEP